MRKQVLVVAADGSEEMETIIPIDVLRRAGAEVTLASIDKLEFKASRGVKIVADKKLEECKTQIFDLIILPGGMPGAGYLRDSALLTSMLKEQDKAKRLIAAICAAPVIVLQHHGLLADKAATCHPALFAELKNLKKDRVVVTENFITSQGPGTAAEFALQLVAIMFDQKMVEKITAALVI